MTCSGCEARREWIRQAAERTAQRVQKLLQRLNSAVTENNAKSKRSDESDCGSKQRIDGDIDGTR